ncbi:MAG: FadR family transcriptional regulator [Verrucomicrobiae bacterium]|nr:FadR family transcriptional regulator [Verrucomicrobiae bacterium]MCP5539555.1 FadR family transcriptional regulator [Akkermansiaceae bacterium]MCP5550045.1 FadR family transcriptional regulator [Akkermansiaceae bacterium]
MIPAAVSPPPERRLSLVEQTSGRLAEHIIAEFSRQIDPHADTWLPSERELAVRFGVSRPVIREATKRLELQGFIEIQHGRGIKVVHQLQRPLSRSLQFDIPDSLERLRQLNETRRILEPESARLAALRADADALAALRSCHRELAECTDLAQAARIDARFHEQIARAAGNAIVALVLSSLGDLGETSRLRTLSQSGLKKAIAHHEAILAAIEAGLPDDAAKLMRTHVEEAATDLEASEGIATRTA